MARPRLSRAFTALALCAAPLLISPVSRYAAAAAGGPPRPGVAVLFVVDRASFEELMAVPQIRSLAAAGGAGLMTTKVGPGDPTAAAYRTIAEGAHSGGSGRSPLLGRVLDRHGVPGCLSTASARSPQIGPLILLTGSRDPPPCEPLPSLNRLIVAGDGEALAGASGGAASLPGGVESVRRKELADQGAALARLVRALGSARAVVMVLTPLPSASMDRAGDEVTPLVMAQGRADQLLTASGAMHALTSSTTRSSGMVSNVDVAPTLVGFFGLSVPAQMDGQPIRITSDPPPFGLHRLHLEQRRIRLPIQLGEVAFVSGLGITALVVLIGLGLRRSFPPAFLRAIAFLALCATALPLVVLAAGLLPQLSYPWAVPFVVLGTLVLVLLSLVPNGAGVLGPFIFLGAAGLAFLAVEGALGGRAFRVPLLGGTMFDGVRYFGLPNSFIALLLASAVFVAAALRPYTGFLLLVAAGMFAGFPHLGVNVGASITLFVAAGVWWIVRVRAGRPLDVRSVAVAAGVVVGGVAVVLLANRLLPGAPNHATRFVERSTSTGLGQSWAELRHRLGIGLSQVERVPPAWLPLVGLPVVLWVMRASPGPIAHGFALRQGWRDVVVTICVASMAAFIANDTGVAAAAPGFLFAVTALAYPAFIAALPGVRPP